MGVIGVESPWRPLTETVLRPGDRLVTQGSTLAAAALQWVGLDSVLGSNESLIQAVADACGPDIVVSPVRTGLDALAVSNPDAKLILLATSRVPGRQRFTLAHELCHLLMSDDQGFHKDDSVYGHSSTSGDSEMRANAFAAAFLMPEQLLREEATGRHFDKSAFCALPNRLHVSPNTLAYRLGNLGLISSGQVDSWLPISSRAAAESCGEGTRYAQAISEALRPRLPRLCVRHPYDAYQRGLTRLCPYANLLGVDVDELRADLESTPAVTA